MKEEFDNKKAPVNPEQSLGDLPTMQLDQKGIGRVDRYELLEKLGEGGFGAVYGARDTEAGIPVALKALPAEVSCDVEEMASIRENFALVSRLHHPNIAFILHLHKVESPDNRAAQAMGIKRGDYLVVMEYAPGATLFAWRRAAPGGKLPLSQAVEICRQIADALDYAHSQCVLHRDIKPKNIMLAHNISEAGGQKSEDSSSPNNQYPITNNCQVKILDFGLAAEIRSSMSRKSKEPQNSKSGTPLYMAPEQWEGKRQDGRADQYALAALFYELVCGEVLFKSAFDSGNFEIMRSVVLREPVAPLEELTKQQNEVLQRALSKNPEERFGSCREFVDALAGVKGRTSKVKSQKAAIGNRAFGELGTANAGQRSGNQQSAITKRKSAMVGLLVVGLLVAGIGVRCKPQRDTALAEQARDLPATVPSNADEQQASTAKVDAKLARERAVAVPDSKIKQEMERQWKIGETAWGRERWQDALPAYQETIRLAGVAQQMPGYFAAKAKWTEVRDQKSEVSQENLKTYAATEWLQSLALAAEAEGLEVNPALGKEKYETALVKYQEAVKKTEPFLVPQLNIATTPADATVQLLAGGRDLGPRSGIAATMEKGKTYKLTVSKKGFKTYAEELVADWTGPKTKSVVLEEQRLPADLIEVSGAALASLSGLASGSAEAQAAQKAATAEYPLEVKSAKTGIAFRLVPAGRFTMGSPLNESRRELNETQHPVTISKPFYCGKFEITQGQWQQVTGSNPSSFKNAGADAPVEQVSWDDCQTFLKKLCELEGVPEGTYRLLTEAQWEYACRAGTMTPFFYGDNLDSNMANFNGNGPYGEASKAVDRRTTVSVGQFKPNAFGLYDMSGNVWEWCSDWYGDYATGSVTDPAGAASGLYCVSRGGSWNNAARFCRSAYRGKNEPVYRNYRVGFRLQRIAPKLP